eukprot:372767-Ditylum_brightwellii.AAC.1
MASGAKCFVQHKFLMRYAHCSPATAGEKENTDVFAVEEVKGKEGDEITPTALVYDDEEQEAAPLAVMKPKGAMLHWDNLQDGRMQLLSNAFVFPKLSFPNLFVVWHSEDLINNISLYRLVYPPDISPIKSDRQKLNMMHLLINAIYRATNYVNLPHFIVKDWMPRKVLDLYQYTKHMFYFPNMNTNATRQYETIVWKTYYNLLVKRKGRQLGESQEE